MIERLTLPIEKFSRYLEDFFPLQENFLWFEWRFSEVLVCDLE